MRKTILRFAIFFSISATAFAQNPALDLKLKVADDAGNTLELRFGLDGSATAGLDSTLNENELPPFPPTSIFEARFIGDDIGMSELGQGTYQDYRTGDLSYNGATVHEIKYQPGANGTAITIDWALPSGVTGVLEDLLGGVVVSHTMSDTGSYTVSNLAIDKLKMTITYNNIMTAVGDVDGVPAQFELEQNYPNPFNPSTAISYQLSAVSNVQLVVYDQLGREVVTLASQLQPAGKYTVQWDGRDQQGVKVASGIYLYRLRVGEQVRTRSMLLAK